MWPVWLNDSRRLIFTGSVTNTGNGNELYILDTQAQPPKPRMIHRLPQGSFFPGLDISRDNRTIYYAHSTVEADLWLLSLR